MPRQTHQQPQEQQLMCLNDATYSFRTDPWWPAKRQRQREIMNKNLFIWGHHYFHSRKIFFSNAALAIMHFLYFHQHLWQFLPVPKAFWIWVKRWTERKKTREKKRERECVKTTAPGSMQTKLKKKKKKNKMNQLISIAHYCVLRRLPSWGEKKGNLPKPPCFV